MKATIISVMLLMTMVSAAQNTEDIWIDSGNRHIYGVLSRPHNSQGRHPVAIIAHGFNGTHHYGKNYFKPLNDLGYQCYTFDFPCGSVNSRSDNNTLEMSVIDEQRDLENIVRYFKSRADVDTTEIVLIGESQGGLVAALTASSMPDNVSRLILAFPALCIPENWNKRYPHLSDIPDTTRVWDVPVGRRFFEEVRQIKVFDTIKRYRKPVLIVQGDKDPIVSVDDSRRAVGVYDNAHLHIIKGAGHGFKGEELEESFRMISDFLIEK